MASRCARNAALNGLSRRVSVADVVGVADAARPRGSSNSRLGSERDAVVVNPPSTRWTRARRGTRPRELARDALRNHATLPTSGSAEALQALGEEESLGAGGGGAKRSDDEAARKTKPPTAHFCAAARAAAVAAACVAAGLGDVTIKRVFTDERARASNGEPAGR